MSNGEAAIDEGIDEQANALAPHMVVRYSATRDNP
jgi:hypothetical protein